MFNSLQITRQAKHVDRKHFSSELILARESFQHQYHLMYTHNRQTAYKITDMSL